MMHENPNPSRKYHMLNKPMPNALLSQRKRKGFWILQPFYHLTCRSPAMVTHVIHIRVKILPTPPLGPFVIYLHVRRHLKPALTHILTDILDFLKRCLYPSLMTTLGQLSSLPIELDFHLLRPVKIGLHTKTYFIVIWMRRLFLWFIKWPSWTITVTSWSMRPMRKLSPVHSGTSLRLGISLSCIFVFCPGKLFAHIKATVGISATVIPNPIVIVPTNVRSNTLVSFETCMR